MVAPTYTTDLTLIDDAQAVANFVATGGGASALNDETDYFINGTQCVSKNGFTADTKGQMADDVSAPTITSGDAVFIWARQANRNLLDTIANGGGQVIMGTSNANFDQFYVDGNDAAGSDLLSWVSYAVDPTSTPSATTGSPGSYDHFGFQWKTLGSGSLKGAPNAVGVIRYGREIRCEDGDGTTPATFTGMADFDADTTRRWGILTPISGGLLAHGAIVMGVAASPTTFVDEAVSILIADDLFVPAGFNEFVIVDASSTVDWTSIQITALGTTSPYLLTLDVGTFTGDLCRFDGASTTTFNTNGSSTCTNSTWVNSGKVFLNEADLSGSSFLTPTVAADDAAVQDDRTTTGTTSITELDNCIFSQGTNAHHAITFGANVDDDITLTGIEFTGFDSTADANGSTLEFLATTGTMNVNLVGCTVDGSPATTSNVGVDDAAGIVVTLVVNPITVTVNVKDENGTNLQNARVFAEVAATISGGEIFEAAVSSLTSAAGTATCTTSSPHGLTTGDKVVIRGAQPDDYNKVASVTVSSTTVFTYSVTSGISSPATGTPVVSFVVLEGLTDASGNIQGTRTWGANQSVVGWARLKNASSPFYKEASLSFDIDSSNGNNIGAVLLPDE